MAHQTCFLLSDSGSHELWCENFVWLEQKLIVIEGRPSLGKKIAAPTRWRKVRNYVAVASGGVLVSDSEQREWCN